MAHTVATFREALPEFEKASDALVQSRLDQATRRLDPDVWGDLLDDGVLYLSAHLLAVSPFGMNARMVNKEGGSTYQEQFKELSRVVSAGYRLAGDPNRPPTGDW